MATRNINSFIEHLMNEAMTTSAAGGSTKAGKGAGKTSTMGGSYRSGPPQDDRDPNFEGPPERPYGGDEPGDKVVFPGAPVDHRPFDADNIPNPDLFFPLPSDFFGRYERIYKPYGGIAPKVRRK